MCDKNGWPTKDIYTGIKRYIWFTPDYWMSSKQGFLSPNIVTIQYIRDINRDLYPGFKSMFFAGAGYALEGKKSLTHSGFGNYLSKIPFIGSMAITRMDSEIKSQLVYQMGGMSSAIAAKYFAMSCLGSLTRVVLQSRNPALCISALTIIKYTNYANTAGGIINMTNQYNLIREQMLVKSFIKSCESVGKIELEKMLDDFCNGAVEGLTKEPPDY